MTPAAAVPATVEAASETLPFFRRHLLPPRPRMMPRMAPRTTAVRPQAAEQEPGEHEQPQRFPIADHRAPEKHGHEPVPQAHYHVARNAEHHGDEHQNFHASRNPE